MSPRRLGFWKLRVLLLLCCMFIMVSSGPGSCLCSFPLIAQVHVHMGL